MTTTKTFTLTQACENIVFRSVDLGYVESCGAKGFTEEALNSVFFIEYGWQGDSAEICKGYLQCLPSVCTVPFDNYEILKELAKFGITASDEAECDLIDNYWKECGTVFKSMLNDSLSYLEFKIEKANNVYNQL